MSFCGECINFINNLLCKEIDFQDNQMTVAGKVGLQRKLCYSPLSTLVVNACCRFIV